MFAFDRLQGYLNVKFFVKIRDSVIVHDIDKPASSQLTIKGGHLGEVSGLAFADENIMVSAGLMKSRMRCC